MLIAQISDSHITRPGSKAYDIAPMADNLARVIGHINQLGPRPDVVVHSGDVTNAGSREEMRHARQLLAGLAMPFYVVPGNHDNGQVLREVFGAEHCPAAEGGTIDYVIEGRPVRLFGMDSTCPGQPGGEITAGQAAWLDDALAREPGKPAIIFMHHPPVKCGVLESDEDGFAGRGLLAEVVTKHAQIERIVCGHIHLLVHARWHGSVVTTAPAMGMRLGLDLTMQKAPEYLLDAPGYLLHHWTPGNCLISHAISLEAVDGPYPFEDPQPD